ncbi:MAG: caspase family protein [Elusimicrobiota bacterium]|nr:MAG: caspase family protein [Elusimicrobiota bacterium]
MELPLGRSLGASRELVVKGKNLPATAGVPAAQGPAVRGEPRPDAFAVVLGVEEYSKAARVSHARRDAAAFRAFATGVLGVPDDAAHLFYLDDGVTLAELRKAFSPNGWLARRVGPQSDVFVFYAGHGAPSLDGKSAYLVPQDGDPNYAVETGFPIDDMLKALDGSKARSATVWLDACFSGADRESRPLLADARPLSVTVAPVVPPGKVALFSAASGSQVSSAFPAKQHGLFTWFALRGLDGEADADKNGTLTAGELADFLGAQVPREAGAHDREQTPGFRGDRERTLARFRKTR